MCILLLVYNKRPIHCIYYVCTVHSSTLIRVHFISPLHSLILSTHFSTLENNSVDNVVQVLRDANHHRCCIVYIYIYIYPFGFRPKLKYEAITLCRGRIIGAPSSKNGRPLVHIIDIYGLLILVFA